MNQSLKKIILILVWISIFAVGFYGWQLAPQGWLGKLRAIGYSVCHQIPSHSFTIGEHHFPLCTRCMGLYLGALIGLVILFPLGRKSGLPSKPVILLMVLFVLAWLVDGGNSFFSDLFNRVMLYPSNNTLRLLTGLGMGFSVAITLATLINYTVWQTQDQHPLISSIYPLLSIIVIGMTFIWLISTQNEILMTIFAYLSIGSIVLLLCLLHMIIWIILFHKENTYRHWKELLLVSSAGFLSAVIQIILLDILRFTLTGTWEAFI